MPSYTVSVQDTSPFLTYTGSWRAGHSSDDPFAERYSESSFTVTSALSSALSFTFYGTGAAIFGSKRPQGHGRYQVTLDGAPQPEGTSVSATNEFNATLWQSANVGKGWHTVVLTNREGRFLDVDTVSWVGSVGTDDEPLIVNTMQDTHPAFTYTPTDAWSTSPFNVGQFAGASGHWTSTPGASVQVTFKGDAIALYGPVGPQAASSFSVALADRPATNYSAQKEFFRARQLLYYGANLGAGEHTLTMNLDSAGATAGQTLAVDYAEVYTAESLGGSFAGEMSSSPNQTGLAIGLALSAALAFLSLALLGVLFAMYKKGRIAFTPHKSRSEIDPDSSYLDHSQERVVGGGGCTKTTRATHPTSRSGTGSASGRGSR
ncbi:hypothetical protein FA13DRAFT_1680234 [Coprinellus micaceus]|uniref:Uncharacterized protein n=1 Tax=Coprinellus micaceus TaxID=71717 RepID=A0A4Y7U2C1_COPMI|nr:hypothetical protein FA13DRAFT_1680234 [Coprinellus micaceus]